MVSKNYNNALVGDSLNLMKAVIFFESNNRLLMLKKNCGI